MSLPFLRVNDDFPDPDTALDANSDAPGLIAFSKQISADQLLRAYRQGIFPWSSDNQPILWWTPDPRMVLKVEQFRLHRSLAKEIKKVLADDDYSIAIDRHFAHTMQRCKTIQRRAQNGTWITEAILRAYCELHSHGYAHSIELQHNGQSIGGLYGVAIGTMFYGESMFSEASNASKIALAALVAFCREQRITLIDCQQNTQHLSSMGAGEISRTIFLQHLKKNTEQAPVQWRFDKTILSNFFK